MQILQPESILHRKIFYRGVIFLHPMYILSMGETKRFPNKLFAIIVFEKDEKKFYSLSISEEEIQRDKEIWDIGSLVLVEGIEKVYDKRNPIYKPVGRIELQRKLSKQELKEFLFTKRIRYNDFIKDDGIKYGIIKVVDFEDIIFQEDPNTDELRANISVLLEGMNRHQRVNVKDYRWVQYWNRMRDFNIHEKRRKEFTDLFKRYSSDIYLIMYKYYNYKQDRSFDYVSGFHWLYTSKL